ncbi:MAG: class I SAM-dependent methyltransferase [Bacteroidota bacterium]
MWDAKTEIHQKSTFYDLENWKQGKTSLQQFELDALGDVAGKSLLHLQCHFGQDTLSWARMGAKVTGVDLSEKAIQLARQLNQELNLDVRFVQSNVLELDQQLADQYDIVFTSYGTIGWLPDLNQWARIIHHFLKPGGIFYIVEFHPFIYMYDWDTLELTYPYFNVGRPFEDEEEGTYANREANIKLKEYFWQHSIADTLQPLLRQGLQLIDFQEFSESPYRCFSNMNTLDNGHFYFGKRELLLPHLFSVKMKKGDE